MVGAPEDVHFKETRGVPSDLLEGSCQVIALFLAGIEMDDDTFVLPPPRLTPPAGRCVCRPISNAVRDLVKDGTLINNGPTS